MTSGRHGASGFRTPSSHPHLHAQHGFVGQDDGSDEKSGHSDLIHGHTAPLTIAHRIRKATAATPIAGACLKKESFIISVITASAVNQSLQICMRLPIKLPVKRYIFLPDADKYIPRCVLAAQPDLRVAARAGSHAVCSAPHRMLGRTRLPHAQPASRKGAWRENATEQLLTLRWTEHGGLRVEEPSRTGFGTRLLQRSMAAEPERRVAMVFHPQGLVCTVQLLIDASLTGATTKEGL